MSDPARRPRFAFLRWRRGESAARGRAGERAAAWWLWWRGYRILERNLSNDAGEIDLVCERRGVCVFVEVKTRTAPAPPDAIAAAVGVPSTAANPATDTIAAEATAPDPGPAGDAAPARDPLDAIDRRKRRNMRAVAALYLAQFEPAEVPHRFDAIAVERSAAGRFRVVRHERDILEPIPPRGLVVAAPASIDAALQAAIDAVSPPDDDLLEE